MSKGTAIRSVRVSDDVWIPAKTKSEQEGVTLSEIVRQALIDFTNDQTKN